MQYRVTLEASFMYSLEKLCVRGSCTATKNHSLKIPYPHSLQRDLTLHRHGYSPFLIQGKRPYQPGQPVFSIACSHLAEFVLNKHFTLCLACPAPNFEGPNLSQNASLPTQKKFAYFCCSTGSKMSFRTNKATTKSTRLI